MYVKNRSQLALTSLRQRAVDVLEAGLGAVDSQNVVPDKFRLEGDVIKIVGGLEVDLASFKEVFVLGIGKVACSVAVEVEKVLQEKISKGIVLGTHEGYHGTIECVLTSHPLPTEKNVEASQRLVNMAKGAGNDDLIISIVTGGGSSMFCLPNQISCGEEARLTSVLMKSGADIREINVVRKHLSLVKGGWLAKYAGSTRMVSLIFSDVPGDDLGMVASGPTVFDKSTVKDAQRIMEKYDAQEECQLPHCELVETPKDRAIFDNVDNILMVNCHHALAAMKDKAIELGFAAKIVEEYVQGEAKMSGRVLLEGLGEKSAVVAGGETTVKVGGLGQGGRNQELVLGALDQVGKNRLVMSCASDGVDNSTKYAGAIGDSLTAEKAKKMNLEIVKYLNKNDSTSFFEKVGDGIETGPLASNVSDLMVALSE